MLSKVVSLYWSYRWELLLVQPFEHADFWAFLYWKLHNSTPHWWAFSHSLCGRTSKPNYQGTLNPPWMPLQFYSCITCTYSATCKTVRLEVGGNPGGQLFCETPWQPIMQVYDDDEWDVLCVPTNILLLIPEKRLETLAKMVELMKKQKTTGH